MSTFLGVDFWLRLYYPNSHAWLAGALQSSAMVMATGVMVMIFFRRSARARSWAWRACFIGLMAAAVWPCAPQAVNRIRPTVTLPRQSLDFNMARDVIQVTGLMDLDRDAAQRADERFAKEWMTRSTPKAPWQRSDQPNGDLRYWRPEVPDFVERAIAVLWWGGAVLLVAWKSLRAVLGSHWLRRKGMPATVEQEEIVAGVAEEMAVRETVTCRRVEDIASPLLTGWKRPVIWLPVESTAWSNSDLRLVLRHELAHWKRRDGWWQSAARFTACFWWWNPLAWLALRHLEADAEMAADESVVGQGVGSPDYAGLLVNMARGTAPRRQLSAGVAMLGRSLVADRVRAIIAFNPHRGQLGRWAVLTALLLGIVGVTVSGMTVKVPNIVEHPPALDAPSVGLAPDQRELAARTLVALQKRHEHLRFLHYRLEETVSRLDEHTRQRITSKSTKKLEVWSDQWTSQHRAQFRPTVMIWTEGAAPFSIGDETSIDDGSQRYYAWGDNKLVRTAHRLDVLSQYLGMATEYSAMRLLSNILQQGTSRKGPWTFDVREVPWQGRQVVQVTSSYQFEKKYAPQVTTWWLDSSLGGALVQYELTNGGGPPKSIWKLEESGTTPSGIVHPKRYSQADHGSVEAIYTTQVTLMETLDHLPPSVLKFQKTAE